MKLLGINNLKKQKGIGKKSIKSKSNTKSKLSKKGGANEYTIHRIRNNGKPEGTNMSNQCFWISLSQGINIIKGNNDTTVTNLRDMVKKANYIINEENESFDTHEHTGAYTAIEKWLKTLQQTEYRINLYIISSSYPTHIENLFQKIHSTIGNNLIIYHTPGHFELVTKITEERGNIPYQIENYIPSNNEHTNSLVYNPSGNIVELDKSKQDIVLFKHLIEEATNTHQIQVLIDMISELNLSDSEVLSLRGPLNNKLDTISEKKSNEKLFNEDFKKIDERKKNLKQKLTTIIGEKVPKSAPTHESRKKVQILRKKIKNYNEKDLEEINDLYESFNTKMGETIDKLRKKLKSLSTTQEVD